MRSGRFISERGAGDCLRTARDSPRVPRHQQSRHWPQESAMWRRARRQGDYSESNLAPSTNEIGVLASGLNAMAKELDASRAELALHQRELEERAVTRTGELISGFLFQRGRAAGRVCEAGAGVGNSGGAINVAGGGVAYGPRRNLQIPPHATVSTLTFSSVPISTRLLRAACRSACW